MKKMNPEFDPGLGSHTEPHGQTGEDDFYVSKSPWDIYEPISAWQKANFAAKVLQIFSLVVLAAGIYGSINLYKFASDNDFDTDHPIVGYAIGLATVSVGIGVLLFTIGAYIEAKTSSD